MKVRVAKPGVHVTVTRDPLPKPSGRVSEDVRTALSLYKQLYGKFPVQNSKVRRSYNYRLVGLLTDMSKRDQANYYARLQEIRTGKPQKK